AGGKGVVQLVDIPPATVVIGPCPGVDPPTGSVCQGRADLGIGSSDQQDIPGSSADVGHSSTVVPVDGPVVPGHDCRSEKQSQPVPRASKGFGGEGTLDRILDEDENDHDEGYDRHDSAHAE